MFKGRRALAVFEPANRVALVFCDHDDVVAVRFDETLHPGNDLGLATARFNCGVRDLALWVCHDSQCGASARFVASR